jgi:transcriptional regulator with XRE-family HTH domain
MRIATRIRQVRLKQMLSLDELSVKANLSRAILAKIENGQEIPSIEMVDRLAEAMGVRVVGLFYDELNSPATPWLTPRLSLQQLENGSPRSMAAGMSALLKPGAIYAASRILRSWVTPGKRRGTGKPSPPVTTPADSEIHDCAENGGDGPELKS